MTVDATYPPGLVQRRQNGTLAVVSGTTASVESGGRINVESGGVLNLASGSTLNVAGGIEIASGGTLNIASGGAITIPTGGQLSMPVTTQSTTSGTITNYGLTLIGTTIASAYTLATPDRAGLSKVIACTVHGASTVTQTVACGSILMINGSTANGTTITFTEPGVTTLVSASTVSWVVINASGSVALT